MKPARKIDWFRTFFANDATRRMRRSFGAVYVRGAAAARKHVVAGPVICVCNHVSWWDGLVALVVSDRVLEGDGYAFMDAENLERLPFFSLIGAIGVDRASAMDGARAVKYAATLLDRPCRLLWVFAQGRERPATLESLGFLPGAAGVHRLRPEATVLPIALRYEPGPTEHPQLFIDIGDPIPLATTIEETTRAQEDAVRALLERSARTIASEDLSSFEVWSRAAPSRWQRVLERALSLVTRPFVQGLTTYSSRS